jgi:hypothetical protein
LRTGADRRRRIEEQGVLAHQSAGRPRDLEDDVDEGLLDAAVAHQANEQAAVGALLERRARAGQDRVVVDVGGAVGLGRGDPDPQAGLLFGREAGHLDLGAKHFAERRLDTEPAKAESRCEGRREQERRGDARQREAPWRLQFSLQGVSRNDEADPSSGPQARCELASEPLFRCGHSPPDPLISIQPPSRGFRQLQSSSW